MPPTKPVLAVCAAILIGYLAYPYVTLYRLGEAIHSGDARTLQHLVNWPSVREGIKEDISDTMAGDVSTAESKGELPGFGASFVRGIATNAVDQRVTPAGLVAATHHRGSAPRHGADVQVNWAFFDSPTQFVVSLSAVGQAVPIRLQLELRGAQWKVTRVWLPAELLDAANART